MFESAIPQNNSNLAAEKGPACDVSHRFALSAVYDIPTLTVFRVARAVTANWHLSAVYQIQSGFPVTISVFGDTAIGTSGVKPRQRCRSRFDREDRGSPTLS